MYLIKEAKTESVYYSNALTLNSVTAILDHTHSDKMAIYYCTKYKHGWLIDNDKYEYLFAS